MITPEDLGRAVEEARGQAAQAKEVGYPRLALLYDGWASAVEALARLHDAFWTGEGHACTDDGGPYMDICQAFAAQEPLVQALLGQESDGGESDAT
jgi:hypothetical protein